MSSKKTKVIWEQLQMMIIIIFIIITIIIINDMSNSSWSCCDLHRGNLIFPTNKIFIEFHKLPSWYKFNLYYSANSIPEENFIIVPKQ